MSRHSRKLDILLAAARVIADKGIFNLTLETVAKEAGISKGGLLYHYDSKEKMIEDMVVYLTESYLCKIDETVSEDKTQRGKWSRAFLDVTLNKANTKKIMNNSLLAAMAVNPKLMKPVQDAYGYWQDHLEHDGIDPVTAMIARLVADGIWLSQLLNINQLDQDMLDQVHKRLLLLIDRDDII